MRDHTEIRRVWQKCRALQHNVSDWKYAKNLPSAKNRKLEKKAFQFPCKDSTKCGLSETAQYKIVQMIDKHTAGCKHFEGTSAYPFLAIHVIIPP